MFKFAKSILLSCATVSAVGASPALCQEDAPVMRITGVAAAPAGFLDYCRREPLACADAGEAPSVDIIAARVQQASRLYWATIFGTSPRTPAPAAAPPAPVARAGRSDDTLELRMFLGSGPVIQLRIDNAKQASTIVATEGAAPSVDDAVSLSADVANLGSGVGAVSVGDTLISSAPPATTDIQRTVFPLDRDGWNLVNGVNRRINRMIRRTTDMRQFGREDVWSAPRGPDARGDCEDFVLAKREALIEQGVPAEALSIAVVETRWGEGHAVLLLGSDKGEFVLDSLSPWVERWDRVEYRWIERQSYGKALDWERVEG